jgi:hypothetical protein
MSHGSYSTRATLRPRPTENIVEAGPRWPRGSQATLVILGLAVTAAASALTVFPLRGGAPALRAQNRGPTIVSQAQLERFAASVDYPVYWVGPKPGFSYELTAAKGRVWVRYLPAGVKAGDPRSNFLVVGTYEQPHSYSGLERAAREADSVSARIPDGGLLVYSAARPTSVYFSYPGVQYQVEVYAPSPETARSIVLAGETAALG